MEIWNQSTLGVVQRHVLLQTMVHITKENICVMGTGPSWERPSFPVCCMGRRKRCYFRVLGYLKHTFVWKFRWRYRTVSFARFRTRTDGGTRAVGQLLRPISQPFDWILKRVKQKISHSTIDLRRPLKGLRKKIVNQEIKSEWTVAVDRWSWGRQPSLISRWRVQKSKRYPVQITSKRVKLAMEYHKS